MVVVPRVLLTIQSEMAQERFAVDDLEKLV